MREKKPLLQRLLVSFLLLITVQMIVLMLISNSLGLFETGYNSSYHAFSYNLQVRAEMLEKMFRRVTRDLSKEAERYNESLIAMMKDKRITVEEFIADESLMEEYLVEEADEMIDFLLSHEDLQGAFVTFGTEPLRDGISTLPGAYIRKDTVSILNDNSYEDWYLLAGSPRIVEEFGIRYYHQWERDLISATDDKDFFNIPLIQGALSGESRYYVSRTFRFREDGDAVNTVTIPLLDEKGTPFGVVGVSFYMGTTMGNISNIALANVNRGFYALTDQNTEDFSGWYLASNSLGEAFLQSSTLKRTLVDTDENIYRYESSDGEKMLGSYIDLQLYRNDSPYKDMEFRLYSFVSEEELLVDVNNFRTLAIMFFLSFVIFSILAIIFVSIQISKPVIRLANEVTNIDSNDEIKLKPTGISEIDLLLNALETFSKKLVETGSRFSSIIDLLEKPIGGFEEDHIDNKVFVTDSISRIFQAPYKGRYYISPEEWKLLVDRLSEKGLDDYQDVYRYILNDMPERYLQMTTRQEKDKTLGIVMDVTEEILEKMQLREESNSDSLTQLLNRRGFNTSVNKLMRELPADTLGAMIFIDLDNLKHVNDNYGHRVGDDYLKAMAGCFSILDEEHSITGRLSGDEFAIFLYGYQSREEIRKMYTEAFDYFWSSCIYLPDGTPWQLCFSAGVAWWPDDARDYTTILKYADFAMYQVKHTTKNGYMEFDIETFNEKQS